MTADLDELERLLRHSTPGPWDAEGNSVRSLQPWSASGLVATTSMAPDMQDAEDNAALIAALRNCAEELIRDARRWRYWREHHKGFRIGGASVGEGVDAECVDEVIDAISEQERK